MILWNPSGATEGVVVATSARAEVAITPSATFKSGRLERLFLTLPSNLRYSSEERISSSKGKVLLIVKFAPLF